MNTRIYEEVSMNLMTVTHTNPSNKTVSTCTRAFGMTDVKIKVILHQLLLEYASFYWNMPAFIK